MITTDEMRILLSINGAASYTTTINEITNVTNNYDKTVNNLISTLAKLVTTGYIVKFGKQCIEAASNLQEVANVVDVTFGASAQKINNWAKQNAASFGLSETAAKRYAGTYGTMAKQFNMTEEQAASMAIELTKLTGDIASFYNITDQAAATKLKAIFTGETESLKELGVVMTQTQLDSYALANGWNKTTQQMTEQEKVILRYQYTFEKLGHAQGDFMRTSDGYANSVRTLKLELENLKVEVGNELIPVAAQGIGALGDVIKAVGPVVITVAQSIRYYAMAWSQASEATKTVVTISAAAIGIFVVWPKVVAIATAAQKLLTTEIVTTGMAIRYTLGVLGIFLGMLALFNVARQASDLKAAEDITNIGDSAAASSGAVDTLADSMKDLGDSTKGLKTFLASFDEVNKVGGGSSLMSNLVTTDDLANIFGAATGIEDLQDSINSLTVPDIGEGTIFDPEWWKDKGKMLLGFVETWFDPKEFTENWKNGIMDIDSFIQQMMPKWHAFFTNLGADIYDALHPDADKDTRETFSYTNSQTGKVVQGLKYNEDGSYTKAYLNSVNQAAAAAGNTTTTNTVTTTQNQSIDISLMLDGRTIASVVTDLQNQKARSAGNSSLRG
ncbi:MAG: hypothetical protein J6Y64_03380 [Ruminococcus sp.]|nr:hypothetical protein [Ruminococcus sp.]